MLQVTEMDSAVQKLQIDPKIAEEFPTCLPKFERRVPIPPERLYGMIGKN